MGCFPQKCLDMIKSASRIFYYEEIKVNKYSAIAVAMSMCFSASAISQEHIKIKGLYLQMPEVEATKILANSLGVSQSDMVRVDAGEGKSCLFSPGRFTGTYKRMNDTVAQSVEACRNIHNNIEINWNLNGMFDGIKDAVEMAHTGGLPYTGQAAGLAYFVNGKMTALTLSGATSRKMFNIGSELFFIDFAKSFIEAYDIPTLAPKSCTKNDVSPRCWEYKNDQVGEVLSLLCAEKTPGHAPVIMLFPDNSMKNLKF
jgi:hypothetical protein